MLDRCQARHSTAGATTRPDPKMRFFHTAGRRRRRGKLEIFAHDRGADSQDKGAPSPARELRDRRAQTTTVGSYPVPDWLAALRASSPVDATRVVSTCSVRPESICREGELYRFDSIIRHQRDDSKLRARWAASAPGRTAETAAFRAKSEMRSAGRPEVWWSDDDEGT